MNPENDRIQVTAGPTSLFLFSTDRILVDGSGNEIPNMFSSIFLSLMMLTDFSCGKHKELVKWKRCERRYIFKVRVPAIQSWPW